MHYCREIGLGAGCDGVERAEHFVDGLLGGFGPAGETAYAIGHAKYPRTLVAEVAIFVVSADSADVG
jgi:hypothetical protein